MFPKSIFLLSFRWLLLGVPESLEKRLRRQRAKYARTQRAGLGREKVWQGQAKGGRRQGFEGIISEDTRGLKGGSKKVGVRGVGRERS